MKADWSKPIETLKWAIDTAAITGDRELVIPVDVVKQLLTAAQRWQWCEPRIRFEAYDHTLDMHERVDFPATPITIGEMVDREIAKGESNVD